MNITKLQTALRQRLSGMAHTLETRLRQAQAELMAPIDLLSSLISNELTKRCDRLLERCRKQADFRDPMQSLDNFDFTFNPKLNRSLVFDLATAGFFAKHEDALFLGPCGTARAISRKPSSCRVIVCTIARLMCGSMISRMQPPPAHANTS